MVTPLVECLSSGNPVHPYEWELHYTTGQTFPRVFKGAIRTTAQAPKESIAFMRVFGPPFGSLDVEPPIVFDSIVVQSKIRQQGPHRRIILWRFGFARSDLFHGVTIDGSTMKVYEEIANA